MKPRQPLTAERALERARDLCDRAEHCSDEIRRKLATWGISGSDAATIIDRLTDERFIDDSRFARMYVREKAEYARWGRRKIAMSLAVKRIPRDIIDEALNTIDDEAYRAGLRHIIERKAASMADADTYDGRTRIFRHAVARGFEPSLVADILRSLHTT